MRYLTLFAATLLTLIGLLLMFTPLPGAAFIFAFGLTLLICTSDWFAERVCTLRMRSAGVDRGLTWLENRLGARIGNALHRTRPEIE